MGRKYITHLDVGVTKTFGDGVAIGGGGKWDYRVKAVARAHGMKMNQRTGEWYTEYGFLFADVLTDLEAVT